MKSQQQATKPVGAVMVVGGGIAGMQAALDLANSGYYVYLVEKTPAIGGTMAQFDKTFPTNDCAMCILSPKLVEVGRHINIELLTLSEVQAVTGEEGDFTVTVHQSARYIDMDKCIACGECAKRCPKKVDNEYNQGLDKRKAVYVKYPLFWLLRHHLQGTELATAQVNTLRLKLLKIGAPRTPLAASGPRSPTFRCNWP
jgi:heterodisulfide reductase subunit A